MIRTYGRLVAAVLLATCIGCTGSSFPDPVPVSGKITLQGKPVEGAKVSFLPKSATGRSASGTTDAQGSFKLTTFKTDDGALPGDYTVTVTKVESAAMNESIDVEGEVGEDYGRMMDLASSGGGVTDLGESKLPEKYASAADSGLSRSVAAGQPNEFEIDLQ